MISKKINIISILLISTLIVSCGYKRMVSSQPLIHIQNINIKGENRISYLLKNNITLISNKDSTDKYDVIIDLKKDRQNKIKNKQGKITRYTLNINAELILTNNINKKVINRSFSKKGDYEVAIVHSETINNEKSATENIMQQLSDEIINFITFLNTN
jgi:hypothetical protein|tara:strand:+ start:257 stop:730 length:474 start_codon:yes stop_codon:yes gene_type:complete